MIACDGFARDEDYERFAEDWCWSQGIYTIKEAYEMRHRASPYPGKIINVKTEKPSLHFENHIFSIS